MIIMPSCSWNFFSEPFCEMHSVVTVKTVVTFNDANIFCTTRNKYTFSPAELSSERGEKEVLADSNQPTAPPSTKSHVSCCAARARRREKMAAEGTSSTTGRSLLQSVLVSAVDSCHCPHPSHPSTALLPIAPLSLSLRPGFMHSKM